VRAPLTSVPQSSMRRPTARPSSPSDQSSQSDGERSAVAPRSLSFTVPARDGGPSIEAMVSLDDLAAARARWRALTRTGVLSILAAALLLCAAPALDVRRRATQVRTYLASTVAVIAALLLSRAVLWYALEPLGGARALASPPDLLLTALTTSALAWLAID